MDAKKSSNCKNCDGLVTERTSFREQEEALILNQQSRPVIFEPDEWQLSYWDGVCPDHKECKEAAKLIAQVIFGCEEQPDHKKNEYELADRSRSWISGNLLG